MYRGEGLVQRRNVAAAAQPTTADEDESERKRDSEEEEDDDKQTRLTLMEEVLLLGLKDKEVSVTGFLEAFFCQSPNKCLYLLSFIFK